MPYDELRDKQSSFCVGSSSRLFSSEIEDVVISGRMPTPGRCQDMGLWDVSDGREWDLTNGLMLVLLSVAGFKVGERGDRVSRVEAGKRTTTVQSRVLLQGGGETTVPTHKLSSPSDLLVNIHLYRPYSHPTCFLAFYLTINTAKFLQ
ncbi:hypothetical protein X798_03216 [Onchocerca flexuosa]|uniref:Uncharacterized protein n=1 Tax=Onchocerca flexuosa TaxID=387005 RepID=A0A238BX30_9BILA|nr:hypothetical protein X798_03216 [Onchocerca flexuosa]